jgi:hypothetical protein
MSGIIKPPFGTRLNRDHPLAADLKGAWLLNEGVGNKIYDCSGQNNHGILTNMADPPTTSSGWGSGEQGNALFFSSSTDYVDLTGLSIPSSIDKTFIFWIKPTDLGGSRFLLDSVTGRLVLALRDASNPSTICFYDGSWRASGVAAVVGVEQMVAFVFQGTTGRIYKNGLQIGSDLSYSQKAIGNQVWLGRNPAGANDYIGSMSSVFCYTRALSAQEIAYLYAFPYCMFEEVAFPAWMVPAGAPPSYRIPPGLLFSPPQGVF